MSSILSAMQRKSAQTNTLTQGYSSRLTTEPRWPVWVLGMGGGVCAMGLGALLFWALSNNRISLQMPSQRVVSAQEEQSTRTVESVTVLGSVTPSVSSLSNTTELSDAPLMDFADIPPLEAKQVDLLALQREQLREQRLNQPVIAAEKPKPGVSASDSGSSSSTSAPGTLKELFAQAVEETQGKDWGYQDNYDEVPWLSQLEPSLTADLPQLTFSSHVYSSDPQRRYVNLNNLQLMEGDFLGRIEVVAIRLDDIVLRIEGHLARLAALTDWSHG